MVRWL